MHLYSIVGAAGELFSIRTNLFEEPPADTLIEDFYLSLKIAAKGFRFAYEPEAYATETASVSVKEEWKRKVRITAGGFQAMARLLDILNPFRYGLLSFQYFSHRVLRWTLAPLALLLLLVSNILLSMSYLALQILFYFIALLGYFLKDKKIKVKGFFVPYYFLVMNLAVYAGLVKYLRGKQSVVWEKAERAVHPS
jgi:poly-beta-1,6-N-acetyl-D-glucosamine synthase